MKQGSIQTILSFLIIFLASCEYDPHGIFERHLDKNVASPELQVVSLDLDQDKDTIVLLYNRVSFRFESSGQAVMQVSFILDDSLLGTVRSGEGYYDIHCDSLFTGNHRLRLEIYTHSGTGSLADSLGMEGILFATREWTVTVLPTRYFTLTSTVSDGFLKLQWPRSTENVPNYIIYRDNIMLGQTTDCEYIDKGYVGEGAEYSVRYYRRYNGELVTYGWAEIPNEMALKYTGDANNRFAVTWEKPKYYAAVDSIIVYGRDGYDRSQRMKTGDIEQTGFAIPASYFGLVMTYQLGLVPKYLNPVYSVFHDPYPRFVSPEITCVIGYPSPIFWDFSRIGPSEFIYHTNKYDHGSTAYNDSIFRYSTRENKVLDRSQYNPPGYTWSGDHYWCPTASPDGRHYMALGGFTGTAVYTDAHNFSNYKIIDISTFTSAMTRIPLSNAGTGIVYDYRHKYLYDFGRDTLLGTIDMPSAMDYYNISPDGRYLFLGDFNFLRLYSYRDDTLTFEKEKYAETWPGTDYFDFMGDEPGKAVGWDKDTKEFFHLACPGLTVIKQFAVEEDKILDIDYFNDQILSFSPGKLVVRSLTDGSVQEEILLKPMTLPPGRCYLGGNSIFSSNGGRYFLN